MRVTHITLSSWLSVCQNYQIWWRFDKVLTKTSWIISWHTLYLHYWQADYWHSTTPLYHYVCLSVCMHCIAWGYTQCQLYSCLPLSIDLLAWHIYVTVQKSVCNQWHHGKGEGTVPLNFGLSKNHFLVKILCVQKWKKLELRKPQYGKIKNKMKILSTHNLLHQKFANACWNIALLLLRLLQQTT